MESLRKAADITKEIYKTVFCGIKPGRSEREIACEIESKIKQKGLKRSFKTIVASGPNSAMPHARITDRVIRTGDVVVVDFGVIYNGCHSDMTRTAIVGKIDDSLRRIYDAVKDAHGEGIRRIRAGLRISEYVTGIHDILRQRGMGKYILHTLGHGVGSRIHEPPKLSEKNRRILKKGIVCTIEPGLYIKDKGGVRIEDMVIVTEKNCEVLTR